ncbi:MAG: FkbM family methyltransferase [Xanthobacteraceae bacterium]
MISALRSFRSILKRLIFGACTPFLGDDQGRIGVRTLTGPAKGMRFRLDLRGDYEMHYWLGNYEREIADRLRAFVKPGWTIWDVGIFIGYYTCLFARLVGSEGQVVAIEADPRNLARTRRHVEMNRFANVTFVAGAIGIPDAEVKLLMSDGSNTHLAGAWIGATQGGYVSNEMRDKAITVRCKSLDQIIADRLAPRPDLIKLDIDGAELWALDYTDLLATQVRPLFLVELHNPECDAAAWRFASRWNYKIERFETGEALDSAESVQGTILLTPRPC